MNIIVLSSNNKKKIGELETLFGVISSKSLEIKTLRDIEYTDEIVEDGTTFEENSLIKARVPASMGFIGIADDSGLAVDFLNGEPGIYSARYSGENANDERNRKKLLSELDGVPEDKRGAKFVCTASFVLPENSDLEIPEEWRISEELSRKTGIPRERAMVVRGECHGVILNEERGEGGFGYDSLFYYPEFGATFAEIAPEQKNAVSHRGVAMKVFVKRVSEILNI